MTVDINLGFERRPEGLPSFLNSKGYVCVRTPGVRTQRNDARTYAPRDGSGWPSIDYYPKSTPTREGEEPDWASVGLNIRSAVVLSYGWHDDIADAKAERLSEEIMERFWGVKYEESDDSFVSYTGEELQPVDAEE